MLINDGLYMDQNDSSFHGCDTYREFWHCRWKPIIPSSKLPGDFSREFQPIRSRLWIFSKFIVDFNALLLPFYARDTSTHSNRRLLFTTIAVSTCTSFVITDDKRALNCCIRNRKHFFVVRQHALAYRVRYCFTSPVRLSVCPSRCDTVLYPNECTYHQTFPLSGDGNILVSWANRR